MPKQTEKTAVYLNKDLEPGIAANTAVHIAQQAGAVRPQIAGLPVKDAAGVEHSGIPVIPNVVLAISEQDLKAIIDRTRAFTVEYPDVLLIDFPEEGFLTTTDEEYRSAMSVVSSENIRYYGCLIHGPRKLVDQLSRQHPTLLWGRHLEVPGPVTKHGMCGVPDSATFYKKMTN